MRHSLFFLTLLLLGGCANRVPPTGGPRDTTPPRLLNSVPVTGDRNFRGRMLALEFDEYIQANKFKDQLIITPRISGDYSYKVRKRTVLIEFDSAFAPNTTYTLNFREAIVDITEKNPAENLLIAFSTGDHLDTLTLTGVARDLLTDRPVAEATIALYQEDDTLDIFSGEPYYFTKSDKNGHYRFSYLKTGRYRLYAFVDENKNLTCQSDREPYGFLPEPIALDSNLTADTLLLQTLNIDTLRITRTRQSGRYFLVAVSKYVTEASFRTANDSTLYYKLTDRNKTIKFYQTFPIADSLPVFTTMRDSTGQVLEDTFYLKFEPTERKPEEFKLTAVEPRASKTYKTISGTLQFSKPIKYIRPDSLVIRRDTAEQYPLARYWQYTIDSATWTLEYTIGIPPAVLDSLNRKQEKPASGKEKSLSKIKPLAKYSLHWDTGTFISVEHDTSEAISQELRFTESSAFGMVSGRVTTTYPSYIIQLLNGQYELVQEVRNVKQYVFRDVPPGEYLLRIFIDSNANGRWDPGNILLNKPPEPVIIYQDRDGNRKTSVRANWEINIDLAF